MPQNPNRETRGGDVEGETPIAVTMGEALMVAKASFDPGYDLSTTLSNGNTEVSKADLVKGYCTYGSTTGS
jgi:hypothetical protein